jgi:hypothetical protein
MKNGALYLIIESPIECKKGEKRRRKRSRDEELGGGFKNNPTCMMFHIAQ